MDKNIILGYGLLGKELVNQTGWDHLSRSNDSNFDFRSSKTYSKKISKYDTVINCIANTDTYSNDRDSHWSVNYSAVADLVKICNTNNQKLVHISTDYLYSGSNDNASENDVPVHNNTWYGYTKLLGDAHIQLKSDSFLIIRCGHKSYPFIHDKAFTNIKGNFDYVNEISSLIISLIKKDRFGIFNVGTKNKTMYELALNSNLKVKKAKVDNNLMPRNISMNLKKMKSNI